MKGNIGLFVQVPPAAIRALGDKAKKNKKRHWEVVAHALTGKWPKKK